MAPIVEVCNELDKQQLPGGTGVNNKQKQPGKWKQRFDAAKAIIGPGFIVGMYEYMDKAGNHAINNFYWRNNLPDECDTCPSAAIAYLDPGSLQADIYVGRSSNLTLE